MFFKRIKMSDIVPIIEKVENRLRMFESDKCCRYSRIKYLTLILLALFLSCKSQDIPPLNKLNIDLKAQVQFYKKNSVNNVYPFRFDKKQSLQEISGAVWQCEKRVSTPDNSVVALSYVFQLSEGEAAQAGVALNFQFNEWDSDNYIIMPSAVYNGNRFNVSKYKYPPLFRKKDYKVDLPITITDVPRLNKYSGESRLDLNTGDMSTPSVGIYFPKTKRGIWIVTEQASELGNNVMTLKESKDRTKAEFTISAPCVRKKKYSMTTLSDSDETGADWKAGDKVTIRCKIYVYDDLNSPSQLNNEFLKIRKSFGSSSKINSIPFSKAFNIMENQQNSEVWDAENGYYSFGGEGWNMKFQLGWVGGCMVTHSLATIGSPISQQRAFTNMNTVITRAQAESGFYYSCSNGPEWCSDCFSNPFPDNLLLLRKNADALYYFYKYCLAQKTMNPGWETPKEWEEPLGKFAGAFVKLWKQYGQFGQFIDVETGEIKVGGTNSAAMAIGGLALAYQYENRAEYLDVAKQAARYYYNEFIKKGITCGGPGEILQNNDSESSFATLESFVVLYEVTGEKEWLDYAEDAASLAATWVVSYDYKFPETSLFNRLDMRTTGSVWASTQNKHGGPGICTLSGDCLFNLYRFTGNKLYLHLIGDIAHNIMQYISREDRQIKKQHPGWVNERVNLSDWEGESEIGELFYGNTWAQVSAMQTVTEIPGIYVNRQKNELYVFDHVEAKLKGNKLLITNPTKFDATVKIFVDNDALKPYAEGFISTCPEIFVKAGGEEEYLIK
jgi:hypothetical protein